MAQQLSKFIPELAPLIDLLSTRNTWLWTEVQQSAFDQTKWILSTTLPTLAHYSITKFRADGCLLNGNQLLSYPGSCFKHNKTIIASKWKCSLSRRDVRNWIDIHMAYQHSTSRQTKPLVLILNYKPLAELTLISECRLHFSDYTSMCLLKYNLHSEWNRPRQHNALSREPSSTATKENKVAETEIAAHVEMVTSNIPATDMKVAETWTQTAEGETLQYST